MKRKNIRKSLKVFLMVIFIGQNERQDISSISQNNKMAITGWWGQI